MSTKERTCAREEIVVIFVVIPFFRCKAVSTLGRNRMFLKTHLHR
jgi:hypothetical protein